MLAKIKKIKVSYLSTALWCGFMMLCTLPRFTGFMLVPFVLIPITGVVGIIIALVFKKGEIKAGSIAIKAIKVAVWSLCILMVMAKHVFDHNSVRKAADSAAHAIVDYHASYGFYPATLSETALKGLDVEELDSSGAGINSALRPQNVYYSNDADNPMLFYHATWIIYDAYHFDFKQRVWEIF